jgi:hypothetical protein
LPVFVQGRPLGTGQLQQPQVGRKPANERHQIAPAPTKPIFQKLELKSGSRATVLGRPSGVDLGKPPSRMEAKFTGEFDFVFAFNESTRALKADLPRLKRALRKSDAAWVARRKGGVTGLGRDSIHDLAPASGLVRCQPRLHG